MTAIGHSLAEARHELDDFIISASGCADCWTTPRAPGKWSPSQVLEHVARSFEAGAGDVRGARSGLPDLPRFVRPLVRTFLFNRVLRIGTFPRARTNKAMNPLRGPESPAEGIARLEKAGIRVIAERDVVVQRLKQAVPGQLGQLTRRMADAGANIEVLYSDHDHQLILVVDDVEKGRRVAEQWSRES